jgi:hypothetical protein
VVLFTASAQDDELVALTAAGAHGFITKDSELEILGFRPCGSLAVVSGFCHYLDPVGQLLASKGA